MVTDKLLNRMNKFANEIKAGDFVGVSRLNGLSDQDIENRAGGGGGSKYGNPPELQGVETLVDFQDAMANERYEEAIGPYYRLKRLLNY